MGSKKDDVDLDEVLKIPACARDWVEHHDWGPDGPPSYIVTGIDGKIFLKSMSDDEAVIAAFILLGEERHKWFRIKRMLEEIEVH